MSLPFQRYETIASGQLRVEKNSDRIYQAFLGTCLGVAMYDEYRKIGGMIHIILPSPPGESHGGAPEKYASTGLPLLLEKMEELGSSASQIQATIAGGSFVGQVSQQDLGLDIGGRSAEIALSFLQKAGVPVIKSETGGFFSCTLELDMTTGETRILPTWESTLETKPIVRPSMNDILDTISALKPIPQTALKILRMFQDDQFGIDDIAQELARDQVLSAQTLKMCNSAMFSSFHVEVLKDAVLLMGEGMLVQAVITAAIRSYFGQTGASGYSLCKGGLYFHALAVAMISEKLAAATGKANPALAYTAGLLHGIGKTILDQYVASCAPLFFRELNAHHSNMIEVEKKVLGITHCEAGIFLAKKWNFSKALSQVIAHHPLPEKASSHNELVCIVYLANLLTGRFQAGISMDTTQTDSLAAVCEYLGVTMDDMPAIVDQIPFEMLIHNHEKGSCLHDGHEK